MSSIIRLFDASKINKCLRVSCLRYTKNDVAVEEFKVEYPSADLHCYDGSRGPQCAVL